MKTKPLAFTFAVVAFNLLLAAGCGSSEPPNGTLACGPAPHPCPEGYQCSPRTKTCWKGGIEPTVDASNGAGMDASTSADGAVSFDGLAYLDGGQDGGGAGGAWNDGHAADLPVSPVDAPIVDVAADASGPDAPVADASLPDAPISPLDVGASCALPKVSCNGQCIDLSAGGCCLATDCAGSCMTCTADHTCTALKGQDDPTGRCTGTCDAAGACKGKKGQACQSSATCTTGTTCADGYCCDKACTGTCEACDVSSALGTCTTLSAGTQPRAGRTPCSGTGTGTCAGTCNGTSSACYYPTLTCGTASCSGSSYQAAGTCSQGTCGMPAVETCTNACAVTSGGCTGVCQPGAVKCSAADVPQLCSAAGAWQDQSECLNGFTCASGACTCASPKTNCTTACADLQSDPNNCGSCGHSCLGGTCSQSMCQPVAMTGNLASAPALFGIDATYIYYSLASTTIGYTADAYRVLKSAAGSNGSLLYTSTQGFDYPYGVVGNKLIINDNVGVMWGFTIGGTATAKSPLAENNTGMLMPRWGSLQPTNYSQFDPDHSETMKFHWYDANNSLVATYSESTLNVAPSGGGIDFSYFAAGNTVYWRRDVYDDTYASTAVSGLYSASSSAPTTRTQLAGGSDLGGMTIIDANAVSLILIDMAWTYYSRVPVPSGYGTDPVRTVNTGNATAITGFATEDASGFYWVDASGNVNRCAIVNCMGTKITLASGQGTLKGFYQDASALYWSRSSPNQIMRLAK